ncbi:Glycosyltransferase family 4 protein [Candidatus Trichorickettsia mobilis]|uniref:Glycosyltransferase family 4 protein n=1 Tax=Candidatus Trichorickettsia mobilis TaxID=1346319 RepID=A0ABZ0UUC9_9RICK|nr:glycosyltransferase family 4 protein [Candidatus Trichorickettsia mobilis]WPY00805.1 Glycosyltransferase family 4 protein [Candidatus Trichorickettsia mobilis]
MSVPVNNNHPEYHKKTILQVLPSLVSGGVERGTIELARKLKELNYGSLVVSAGGPLLEQLKELDIPHIKLDVDSKNPLRIKANAKNLEQIIKDYNVDLVHARSRAPAWSCYMATRSTNAKFITTFHGIYNISGMFKKYYNSIMTKGEVVIAVSNFVKQHILQNYDIDEDKIRIIYRGVDPNYFTQANISDELLLKFKNKYRVPKSIPVILLPARMTEWKGHINLIEALNKIKHLDFYCLMVGDLSKHPAFAKKVMDRITELKLQTKIQIFGNELDMLGLYGIADLVLSTSIEPEAFGRTIIEGQSMEKLVIATNIGGAAETIIDGVSGYHVKPNNIDDLADKIQHCLAILGSNQAKELTAYARQSVLDNFSLKSMLNKTLSIYDEVYTW